MKSNIPPLQVETFYHLYNRGVNGGDIFRESENYTYFLNKYADLIAGVADTYAYSLLKNHFHLLIRTKSEAEIQERFEEKKKPASSIISLQFSHLFNGYAQAINKKYNRT